MAEREHIHELKTDPEEFEPSFNGYKKFELRQNDRDFKDGDTLILRETKFSAAEMAEGQPLIYTGRRAIMDVVWIMHGPKYALPEGWCIMTTLLRQQEVDAGSDA